MSSQVWQQALWALLEHHIFRRASTPTLYNMYRDEARRFDVTGATELRRENVKAYLSAFRDRPDTLIVGEAPGPWGCRFTGVPYTSERLYECNHVPFRGRKTSLRAESYAESTATIFWKVMTPHFPRFLIWNAVPFHPHRVGEPLSIRTPSVTEVRAHLDIMEEVLRIVSPQQVLAVGRIAQRALSKLNHDCVPIRHPSHGGATAFRNGIEHTLTLTNGITTCIPSS